MKDSFFDTAKIQLTELYNQSIQFVSETYENVSQYFSMASPMGQLLQVVNNLGRMILYYIEDSITELNINTATRSDNVKGIIRLTGHNPTRAIASRGTLTLRYNGEKLDIYGNTIIIQNYTQLYNNKNSLPYTIVLPGELAKLELNTTTAYIDVNVIQGTIETQQSTGNGEPLQSFNFQSKRGLSIDNFFVNVFVDGKKWESVESILDMGYNAESCIVKTGTNGGIDVFFGNGFNGAIPRTGATIQCEYLLTSGELGNLNSQTSDVLNGWKFKSSGYSISSEEIDLNKYLKVTVKNDIIFGTYEEPLYLSRLIAPHMSRSFTLANQENYIYFLKKLNIFSIVDAIPGFATFEDQQAINKYNQAKDNYNNINTEYKQLLSTVGESSQVTKSKKLQLDQANKLLIDAQTTLTNQQKDDNTVYLYLVPDVNKRIASNQNYYTCSLDSFKLTENEKIAILDLIEESGQRILTIDNAILQLKYAKFSINIILILYDGFDFETIRQDIISKTSEYFLKNTRRDRIPVSDLTRIIEGIDGVDSVNVWFDADINNQQIYNNDSYGIDNFGDIILERYVTDAFNNKIPVKDIYPLIRGGFTSYQGIDYEDNIDRNKNSSINISVRGYTKNDINSKTNKTLLTTL